MVLPPLPTLRITIRFSITVLIEGLGFHYLLTANTFTSNPTWIHLLIIMVILMLIENEGEINFFLDSATSTNLKSHWNGWMVCANILFCSSVQKQKVWRVFVIIASDFPASRETALMSLYVTHQMEALHSSLFSLGGVHIPWFGFCFFVSSAGNFPWMWLEKKEEGRSVWRNCFRRRTYWLTW